MKYNKRRRDNVREMQKRMVWQAMYTAKHPMDYSAAKRIGVMLMYPIKYRILYPEIERWMRENNVSINRLSMRLGINKATMQNYLYGVTDFKLSTIRKLVELTGIPFETLFRE